MTTTPARNRTFAPSPAVQPSLPDELLEDIFLRLDDTADLTRAYASCSTFHRIVSGRHFLRRYRSLHRPPVVSFLALTSGSPAPGYRRRTLRFHPAEPPHCSAPAAADFALAFLSDPSCWRVRDVRDGRALLSRQRVAGVGFEDLIVYGPLHRRQIQIGPIPGDLDYPSACNGNVFKHYEPFLDPATDKEKETEDEDMPLRVICNVVTHPSSSLPSPENGEP